MTSSQHEHATPRPLPSPWAARRAGDAWTRHHALLCRLALRTPAPPDARSFRSRFMLRMLLGSALCFARRDVAALGLWWRLSSGPIELNLATPWLKAAIEENFGGNHSVAVGGTQLERDERGARRCACATSWCAMPTAPLSRARRRPRSGFPAASLLMRTNCARKASIWSAPKWRCASRPTAASPYSPAPTSGRSRRAAPTQAGRSYCRARPNRVRLQAAADARGVRSSRRCMAWIDGVGETAGRPRPARARSQERQSHCRRPAQRQAMEVRRHQCRA